MPMNSAISPLSTESPSSEETATKATHISAKYSHGPKISPSLTTCGAIKARHSVPMMPATNEPMAAVASAAGARPLSAIWWPSMVVTIEPVSPGVLIRIEVVEEPYMAP